MTHAVAHAAPPASGGGTGQKVPHPAQGTPVVRQTHHRNDVNAPTTTTINPPSITDYTSTMALRTLIADEAGDAHDAHALTTADLARRAAVRASARHAAQRQEREALHAAQRKEREALQVMAARQANAHPPGATRTLHPGAHTEGLPPALAPDTRTAAHTASGRAPLAASAEASYAALRASMQQTPASIDTLAHTLQQAAQGGQLRRAALAVRAGQAVFQRAREQQADAAAHGTSQAPATHQAAVHARVPTTAERRRHVALALERERHTYVLDALKLRLSQEIRCGRERARLLRSYEQEVIRWRNAHLHSEALRISLQSSVRALETILSETRQQWAESQRELTDLRTQLQHQQAVNLMSVRPPAVDMSRLLVGTPNTSAPSQPSPLPTLPMLLRDRLQHAAQTFRRRIDSQDASQAS